MNSERSDIDVKVTLDIEKHGGGYDDGHRSIRVFLERQESGLMQATVQAYGFETNDEGARAVSEALDLVALGIDRALPDESPDAEAIEQATETLMAAGLSQAKAREAAQSALALLRGDGIPAQEPMHPQDTGVERGGKARAERETARRDIRSFETPQRVRDARAARRAERKGFNPKPKGGQ